MNTNAHNPGQQSDKCSSQLHQALQSIYRSLIEQERVEYERLHGEQSEDDFIQVLTYADSLRWLDALTRLIALLDIFDDTNEYSPNASRVIARKVKGMVASDSSADAAFTNHYQHHLAGSEEFNAAHNTLLAVLDHYH
jgi:hypothetical protein